MELSDTINEAHLSRASFDDSWNGISFEEENSSHGESDEKLARFRRDQTCVCINGVLALLSSPTDARKPTEFSFNSTTFPIELTVDAFDQPPVRPRRSFDSGWEDFARRSKSEMMRDRFQLSRSEHISRSFRAPRRPSRGFENAVDDQEGPETAMRPSLLQLDSSRDVRLLPPTRMCSEAPEDVTSIKTLMSTDPHEKITSRSAERVAWAT